MSEQENTSGGSADRGSPVAVTDSASSKHTPLYRPTELENETAPDLHQKRAPAVTSMSPERHKVVAKKLSSSITNKKREPTSPVAIPMVPIEKESKLDEIVVMASPTQPIPSVGKVVSPIPSIHTKKETSDKTYDEDSITSETLQTPEAAKQALEWSDEEEAGGLPRSESRESRGSRVTRVVRQLFCCGVQLEAPSEDNVSSPRNGFFNSGI